MASYMARTRLLVRNSPSLDSSFFLEDREAVENPFDVGAVETVQVQEGGVEFGADLGPAGVVPAERWAVVAEVAGKRGHVVGGVGQLQHARGEPRDGPIVGDQPGDRSLEGRGRNHRELVHGEELEVRAARLLAGAIVERKGGNVGSKRRHHGWFSGGEHEQELITDA
jgi:hypothetical protein